MDKASDISMVPYSRVGKHISQSTGCNRNGAKKTGEILLTQTNGKKYITPVSEHGT